MSVANLNAYAASRSPRMSTVLRLLLAASVISASAVTAQTQTTTAPAGEHRGMMRHGPMDPAQMQAKAQKHLANLKAKLQISPAQEGAWGAFASAMTPPADAMQRHQANRAEMAALSTPERMDKMKALRAQRDAHMDQRAGATKLFYAALSPEQQKVFDAQAMRSMRHGPQGHMGG